MTQPTCQGQGTRFFKSRVDSSRGTPIDAHHSLLLIAMIEDLFLALVQTIAELIASMMTNVKEKPGYTLYILLDTGSKDL